VPVDVAFRVPVAVPVGVAVWVGSSCVGVIVVVTVVVTVTVAVPVGVSQPGQMPAGDGGLANVKIAPMRNASRYLIFQSF